MSNLFTITDEIGVETLRDFTVWALEMRARNRTEPIPLILMLSSPGGEIAPTLDIAALMLQLREEGLEVITFAAGLALSAAVALLVVGTPGKRFIAPYCLGLFHEGTRPDGGDSEDKELAFILRTWERQDATFNSFIAEHSKLSLRRIQELNAACTSFGAEEAIEWGLADQIGYPLDDFVVEV